MNHPRLLAVTVATLGTLFLSQHVHADLATDETSPVSPGTSAQDSAHRPVGSLGSAATTNDANRSVDLLLQLQDRPDLTSATARRSSGSAATATAKPQNPQTEAVPGDNAANVLKQLKTAVFADRPQSADSASTRVESSQSRDSQSTYPNIASPDKQSNASVTSGESLLAHPIVRFLRDNRTAVLAVCGAMLGLFGLATVLSGRRR